MPCKNDLKIVEGNCCGKVGKITAVFNLLFLIAFS